MKGIILAGGNGTRLHPLTIATSKHLLPIYDKPMIYYSLSVLMLADIREILIISTPENLPQYKRVLSAGAQWGLKIEYAEQKALKGIAESFLIGESFINNDSVCLVLGDNFFYGPDFSKILQNASHLDRGALIFGYLVQDPERFGVVEFNENLRVLSLEEKPLRPKSNYAIPGLYFYDNNVVSYAKKLRPSKRGELEITDLNNIYLSKNELNFIPFEKGFAWLDTGTHESLFLAGQFVRTIESMQGIKIACLEEIALNKKWISPEEAIHSLEKIRNPSYGGYIQNIRNSRSRTKIDNIHF